MPRAHQREVFGPTQDRSRVDRGNRVAYGVQGVLHNLWLDRGCRTVVAKEVIRQLFAKEPINVLEPGEHLEHQRGIRTESVGPSAVQEGRVAPALREAGHVATGQLGELAQDAQDLSEVRVQVEGTDPSTCPLTAPWHRCASSESGVLILGRTAAGLEAPRGSFQARSLYAQGESLIIEVRRAADRLETHADGIVSRHSFAFGPHYDPANTRFGALVTHNDDVLSPGAGFPEHPHRDLEIVTWVVSGALQHADSTGGSAIVRPGMVGRLSTGAGVRHSEINAWSGVR